MLNSNKTVIPLAFLALAVLCGVLVFANQQPFLPTQQFADSQHVLGAQIMASPSSCDSTGQYVSVQPGTGGKSDLFYCTVISPALCIPLTQSPMVEESWPIFTANGNRIAYYAQSDEKVEIALLSLPPTSVLSSALKSSPAMPSIPVTITLLTEQAGKSGLHIDYKIHPVVAPSFSNDGQWIAFPAKSVKGNAVELFVARPDGNKVRRITDKGWLLREYVWLGDASPACKILLMTFQKPNDELQQWQAFICEDESFLWEAP